MDGLLKHGIGIGAQPVPRQLETAPFETCSISPGDGLDTLLLGSAAMPPYSFADRTELKTAVNMWCVNRTTANSTYGPIGQWDISRVTSLANMFCELGVCRNYGNSHPECEDFNDDISAWDTSSVTSLNVRSPAFPRAQHAFSLCDARCFCHQPPLLACASRRAVHVRWREKLQPGH